MATLYLAMLLGSTLFPDKSGMKVAKRLVGCVIDHEQTGGYAWGVAALAYLYRELGKASRAESAGIAGCSLLLRVIIFTYNFNSLKQLESY